VSAQRVRGFVNKCDTMRYQPFVGLGTLIGKSADDFLVVYL